MASVEALPTDIYDEIHQIFSRISQIDQRVNRAIQECNQLGNSVVIAMIKPLREEHEDVKRRLQGFMDAFCLPNYIPLNLEVSQMEEEAFWALSTKQDNLQLHLEPLMEVLQTLMKEEEAIDDYIIDLTAHFNGARNANLSKDVAFVPDVSTIRRRRELLKDLSASLVGMESLGENDKKAMDQFVSAFTKATASEEMEVEEVIVEKTLEDVIADMYGFDPSMVKTITESLVNQNMIKKGSAEQEGAGALNWECIKNSRIKFEALKKRILDVDGVKRKGSKEMPRLKGAVVIDEMLEILKVVRDWVFHLESNFSALVNDLHAMMSGHEAAAAKLQEFKSAMENLRSSHNGMVSIAVYKVLAMQEGENLGGIPEPRFEPESSWASIDKETLYETLEFNEMIDLLQEIILQLMGILITSGLPSAKPQNIEVLDSFENALQQSQAVIEEIERKMLWAISQPEVPVPAGKGKMIVS